MNILIPKIKKEVLEAVKGNKLYAAILTNRGIDTKQKIDSFKKIKKFNIRNEFKEMNKAIERIKTAISKKEVITIWGDMDCDGATSTVILKETLDRIGAIVNYHLPNRQTDGYGMDNKNIDILAANETKLILTCDCGISNAREIQYAKEKYDIETIVTDHHSLPWTMPSAVAIINPKLLPESHPAYNVPGAVVAYYLSQILLEEYGYKGYERKYEDLIALAIIADCVPLLEENRTLLKKHYKSLLNTERYGLKYLINTVIATKEDIEDITEEDFAFQVVPKINAAGRLEHIKTAVKMLIEKDEKTACFYANKLEELNTARKEMQNIIVKEAEEKIENNYDKFRTIQLYNKEWHVGVVGIIAGRVADKYKKPTIVLTENKGKVTGSARSIEGVSLIKMLNGCKKYLAKYGGHDAAAGLTIEKENLKSFAKAFENRVRKEKYEVPKILVDAELEISDINEELYEEIRLLAPYGQGFHKPLFYTKDLTIRNIKPFIAGIELTLEKEGQYMKCTLYESKFNRKVNDKINIVYTLQKNTWANNIYINPIIEEAV